MSVALVIFLGALGAEPTSAPREEALERAYAGGGFAPADDASFWAAHQQDDGAGLFMRYHTGFHGYGRELAERFTAFGFGAGMQAGASWDRWILAAEVAFSTLGGGDEESDPEARRAIGICGANRALLAPGWALIAGICYHHAWMPEVAGHGVDFDLAVASSLGHVREPGARVRMDLISALRVTPLWLADTTTGRATEGLMLAWTLGMSFDIARWHEPGR
jgi:hypothetical protein